MFFYVSGKIFFHPLFCICPENFFGFLVRGGEKILIRQTASVPPHFSSRDDAPVLNILTLVGKDENFLLIRKFGKWSVKSYARLPLVVKCSINLSLKIYYQLMSLNDELFLLAVICEAERNMYQVYS